MKVTPASDREIYLIIYKDEDGDHISCVADNEEVAKQMIADSKIENIRCQRWAVFVEDKDAKSNPLGER